MGEVLLSRMRRKRGPETEATVIEPEWKLFALEFMSVCPRALISWFSPYGLGRERETMRLLTWNSSRLW
jgi:hypothetical protein